MLMNAVQCGLLESTQVTGGESLQSLFGLFILASWFQGYVEKSMKQLMHVLRYSFSK